MLITMPPVGAAPARDWVPQRLWECLLLWERPLAATWGHSPCGSGPWPRLGYLSRAGRAPTTAKAKALVGCRLLWERPLAATGYLSRAGRAPTGDTATWGALSRAGRAPTPSKAAALVGLAAPFKTIGPLRARSVLHPLRWYLPGGHSAGVRLPLARCCRRWPPWPDAS